MFLFRRAVCCISLISAALILNVNLAAGVEGTVTANVLNVRVRPGTKHTVVAQLEKGEKVDVIRMEEGWYEIAAPKTADVWVAAAFIKDGIVQKELMLRSGPSIAYSPYGTLFPGQKVEILDKSRESWVRIAVTEGLTAWVSGEYIIILPEDALKLAGISPDGDKPEQHFVPTDKRAVPEKKIIKEKRVDAKVAASSELPFAASKSKTVSMEGILVPLDSDAVYVTHAIASRVNKEYFPLCYIRAEKLNLKLWEGKKVQVTGRERWVKGWQRPVVEIDMIDPLW